MKIGDIVTRKSYGHDIKFCVIGISVDTRGEIIVVLKALYNDTLLADAPMDDLVPVWTRSEG